MPCPVSDNLAGRGTKVPRRKSFAPRRAIAGTPIASFSSQMPRTFDETFTERWTRRLFTGPALLAATPAYLALLPATLGIAAASDLARGRPWTATRFAAAVGANLAMHVVGFGGVFGAWLAGRRDPGRERAMEQRLQVWWARSIWRSLEALYQVDLHVDGEDCLDDDGPIVLLSRHASLLDTLLPLVVLGGEHGWRLRYVMKRELLWDPAIDAIGHRWPTAFVRRGTRDPREVENVAMLGDQLGARDAIVLFPEGTRFTEAKRARALEKLAQQKPEVVEHASRLTHVLPAHPAGPLVLLDVDHRLDVVFCAHTGLEGANHFEDLMDDALLGASVKMSFWRVPRAEIPESESERVEWLQHHWERVNRWVAGHTEHHPGGGQVERVSV